MVVRIRFRRGPQVGRKGPKNRRVALAAGGLLTPGAVMAMALGFWRLAADLKWTDTFAIPDGLFSHWQVWMATAAILQFCSSLLSRYARNSGKAAS
jgi:hypothetical protein